MRAGPSGRSVEQTWHLEAGSGSCCQALPAKVFRLFASVVCGLANASVPLDGVADVCLLGARSVENVCGVLACVVVGSALF